MHIGHFVLAFKKLPMEVWMQSPEQGYAIEAVKIPLSGSVAGFAGDRRSADKARYFD
jgi:hypothetical protein